MAIPSTIFCAYSRYYDLLYQDKDYASETDYIQALLARYGINQGDFLELGSGTGKHGCLLAGRGFSVHGIERSSDMVAQAEKKAGFTCQSGDICTVKMGRTYDAVLSLFHVISYQISNYNLNAVFASAAEHLNQNGLFVFDFWYSPAVYSQRPSVRVKRMANDQVEITRIAEPTLQVNENRVDVSYTIYARDLDSGEVQTLTENHPMRHFSLPEIDLLAATHGFERVAAEEFLTGAPAGEDTWGVCVILQKRSA
jgi:SAM-dependent methyltransferase